MIKIENKYKRKLSGIRFIDLFAGIGGFRLALESFGANCVFSSEWDKYSQMVYKKNFNETPNGDITKIDKKNVPKHNILCAGFPCQAFSISGKQKGFQDVRGTLFFEILRIANYHKPEILLLENVSNFKKHNNGKTLKVAISILKNVGYNVFYKTLNASYYGVPEKRERLYIVGIKKELNINNFEFPKKSISNLTLKDILLPEDEVKKYIIKREDIRINKKKKVIPDLFGHYPPKPIRVGTVNKGGQGERIYHENGHAITLSAYGGGVGAKTGLYLINKKVRKLAPKECARIMGFPNHFIIHNIDSQAYKQFGNSVVINVLQYIIIELIKQGVIKHE